MNVESAGFDKIYCYENSNVLKNKCGVRNQERLNVIEHDYTLARTSELRISPIKGNLDYNHLKAIHKTLFQDIYDWAGKERTVDIAKSNLFCRAIFINDMAEGIFPKLAEENYLIGCPKDKAVDRLAYYKSVF